MGGSPFSARHHEHADAHLRDTNKNAHLGVLSLAPKGGGSVRGGGWVAVLSVGGESEED